MSKAVMQMALEALERVNASPHLQDLHHAFDEEITALKQALAEPEQEPVAYLWQHSETGRSRVVTSDQIVTADATWFVVGPLYLGSAPTPRKPLTDDEIGKIAGDCLDAWSCARAIERAHGITGDQT